MLNTFQIIPHHTLGYIQFSAFKLDCIQTRRGFQTRTTQRERYEKYETFLSPDGNGAMQKLVKNEMVSQFRL